MTSPYAEILIRPDRGSKAYSLHCRFSVDAFPTQGHLEQAKYVAAEKWVADMEKQGWEYLDKHGIEMHGPMASTPIGAGLPSVASQERLRAKDAVYPVSQGARLLAGAPGWVSTVPTLSNSEKWDYDLAAVFVRKTLVFEYNEEI